SPERRRKIVYKSRARDAHSDARTWVPFPNVDSFQTLEDLLDDDEHVPSGHTRTIADSPVTVVNAPKPEPAPAQEHPPPTSNPHRTAPRTRRPRRQHRRRRPQRTVPLAAV